MTRQKTVFETSEIAHLWAHKTQANARNKQGNFYFDGDVIFSYGGHFPIARHITTAKGVAILFTTRDYSTTTAKHISLTRRAIPSHVPVFNIPSVGRYGVPNASEGMEYHAAQVKAVHRKLQDAKSFPSRVKAYREAVDVVFEANRYQLFFYPRRTKQFNVLPDVYGYTVAEINAEVARVASASEARQTARNAARTASYNAYHDAREARRLGLAAHMPQLMEEWRNGENPLVFSYGYANVLHDYPVMLRVSNGEVQTSHGARVPLAHAAALLAIVRRVKESATPYQRNGHTIHIGHYAVESIDAEGNIKAGCHDIAWDEIERFEPRLEAALAEVGA